MFFSILIPVYNVQDYLRQCVDSVLAQDEQDLEILLVDDGSQDRSGEICDEYAGRYPEKIRVIHRENEGLVSARRLALREAKGDWFVHLDSDDMLTPGALSAIRRAAEQTGADLVLCKAAYGDESGERIERESDLPFGDLEVFGDKHPLYMQFLYGGQLTSIWQKIARRDVTDIDTDYSPWYGVGIMEDHLQSLPLLDRSRRPVFLDRAVVYYRMNPSGMTKQKTFEKALAAFASVRTVLAEEEPYRRKWELFTEEERRICAKHIKTFYRLIGDVYRSSEDRDRLYGFLRSVAEDPLIRKEFRLADLTKTGPRARLCFRLIFLRKYRSLRILFQ
jgi:glycosyltransferase involved in cell wall biosynthesis